MLQLCCTLALLAALPLLLSGCPSPWSDRADAAVRVMRVKEEADRGRFVIEDGHIVFERMHIARHSVIEDTIDGKKVHIYHGKEGRNPYFAVLARECSNCSALVNYDIDLHDFKCPSCGSRYDDHGLPTWGPAKLPLETWQVEIIDDRIIHIMLKRDEKYTEQAPGSRT